VGSANTASARSDTGDLSAVVGAAEPLGGGRDSKGDGHGREVEVLCDGDGGGVLDDCGGAADGGHGRRLHGAGRGDVGAGDGHGGGGAQGGGDGGWAGPGRGAGHVAVAVDAALGAGGGVDAGHLGGGDVGHGCGRGVGGGSLVSRGGLVGRSSLVGRSGRVARCADRGDDRGAGRSDGRRADGRDGRGAGRSGSRGTAGRRASCDRAVLVGGVSLDGVGNVLCSLFVVQLEVVGVGLDGVGTKSRSADKVVDAAVILKSRGVGSQTSKAGGIAGAAGLASTSAQSIVRLVGNVPRVAEQGDSSDVAADTSGGAGHTRVTLAGAPLVATVAGQDVADDGSALTVAAQDNGGFGALGVVCIDLLQGKDLASSNGWTVVGGVGVVCYVLVVTALARQKGTDTRGEVALTAGV
jgi:hypothetical protein